MSSLIYLASPYSHADPEIRTERFRAACTVAGRLMMRGKCVFSPIAHSHSVEQFFGDGKVEGHDFWLKQDFAILRHVTELHVLRLDGWEKSFGIAREVELAGKLGIPVYYIDS